MTVYTRVNPNHFGDLIASRMKRLNDDTHAVIIGGPNEYGFGLEGWLQKQLKTFTIRRKTNGLSLKSEHDVQITDVFNTTCEGWAFTATLFERGSRILGELVQGYYTPDTRLGEIEFLTGPRSKLGKLEKERDELATSLGGGGPDGMFRELSELKAKIKRIKKKLGLPE